MNMYEYVNSQILDVYNCNPTTSNKKWYIYSCRTKVQIA